MFIGKKKLFASLNKVYFEQKRIMALQFFISYFFTVCNVHVIILIQYIYETSIDSTLHTCLFHNGKLNSTHINPLYC